MSAYRKKRGYGNKDDLITEIKKAKEKGLNM